MPERRRLVIVGGTVIDGTGSEPLSDAVLVIEGDRILAVGDRSLPIPPDSEQIVASGRYLIPGLMDANVHLFAQVTPEGLFRYEHRYGDVIIEAAQVALKNGLTTVFDTWGPIDALRNARTMIDAGTRAGPRIYFAGNIIGLGGPTSDDFFAKSRAVLPRTEADAIDARWEQGVGAELLWMTAEEVRCRVREYIARSRPDFVKYAGSGHVYMQFISFSEAVQRAIVEEAHAAGLTAQAHTTSPESLRMEIEAGCDILQHGDLTGPVPMPEATLRLIVERRLPCAALLVTRRFLAWNAAQMPEPMKTANRVKDDNDRRLVDAGAVLLLTSDSALFQPSAAGNPLLASLAAADDSHYVLGEGHFHWLTAAIELGMHPMTVLQSATRNVARAYRVDRDLGTLEPGKRADFLILNRDPLGNPAAYRDIHSIFKGGSRIDRDALPDSRVAL